MTTRSVTFKSQLIPGLMATVDPYGENPLAAEVQSASSLLYGQAVMRGGRPPKLFTGGAMNLPAITASGIDPIWLRELPATARHFAASLATEDEVTGLILRCTDPSARYDHPGLDEAIARMKAWVNGPAPASASARPATTRPSATSHRPKANTSVPVAEILAMSKRGEVLPGPAWTPRPSASPAPHRGTPAASTPRTAPRPATTIPAGTNPDDIFRAVWPTTKGA